MKKARLLIVEDDGIIRMELVDRLQNLGYDVVSTAVSGEEAVEQAQDLGPDLVLMDIKLKGEMDGVKAAEQIRASLDVPVVYLTAYADDSTLQRAKITEPFGFIIKPFEEEELRSAIEIALYKHQMESRLRKSEEQYRLVSEATSDYFYGMSLAPDNVWRMDWIDGAFQQITGFAPEEIQDIDEWISHLHPDDLPTIRQMMQDVLSGRPSIHEYRLLTKTGQECWLRDHSRPIWDSDRRRIQGVVGAVRNITERKQAEEALQWQAAVNAAIAELSSSFLLTASISEISGFVLEHAKRLTGSPFGYVGYIDPQSAHLVVSTLSEEMWDICRVEDKGVVFEEYKGLWGWVLENRTSLLTNTPADDPRSMGTPEGHIAIHRFLSAPALVGEQLVGQVALVNAEREYTQRDLALVERLADLYAIALQRHWAEEILQQRTVELETRNEELDAFAHTVAHDLKNPLGIVVGFAELLRNDYATIPVAKLEESLCLIADNARKLHEIIDELLLLAVVRKTEVELTPLDMAEIVTEAQRQLASSIEEAQAQIVPPDIWPPALGYAPWVEQVWINYLSNAIKYGGRPPRIKLGATVQTDGMVCFWIRDNGPGLTQEEQARLFVQYTQVRGDRTKGHGLGLSIVRRIVERLGGEVGAESEGVPGRGSVFTFTLPGMRL